MRQDMNWTRRSGSIGTEDLAHDPAIIIAPLRRQAVADIAKECAPTIMEFVTAMISQLRAGMIAAAGFGSVGFVIDRLKSDGESPIIEIHTSTSRA